MYIYNIAFIINIITVLKFPSVLSMNKQGAIGRPHALRWKQGYFTNAYENTAYQWSSMQHFSNLNRKK